MAINIKNKTAAEEAASAHDHAADAIETEITTTKTGGGGKVLDQTHEHDATPVTPPADAVQYEYISVGISFKMPVADYTMLEFSIRRSVPFVSGEGKEDEVFEATKTWVEAKLNAMLEEQQAE